MESDPYIKTFSTLSEEGFEFHNS